jgi:hypothetical protein
MIHVSLLVYEWTRLVAQWSVGWAWEMESSVVDRPLFLAAETLALSVLRVSLATFRCVRFARLTAMVGFYSFPCPLRFVNPCIALQDSPTPLANSLPLFSTIPHPALSLLLSHLLSRHYPNSPRPAAAVVANNRDGSMWIYRERRRSRSRSCTTSE